MTEFMKRRDPPARKLKAGVIHPSHLYRLDEVKARMGWREAALTAAHKAGLKTHRCGKRTYVLGADVIAMVTSRTS